MKIRRITLLPIITLTLAGSLITNAQETTSSSSGKFTHESQLSVIINSGNTESETYRAKQKTTYQKTKNIFTLSGAYLYGKADDLANAESWNLGLRYEREINKKFNAFIGHGIEGDRFAGLVRRQLTDIGGKYFWIKKEGFHLFNELGYRYAYEIRKNGTKDDFHYGRLYAEVQKDLNKDIDGKLWVEYLPNFTESDDYQVNFEGSLNVMMNKVFSLKMAYEGKYDHVPALEGNKKLDSIYTTSLVAKF